MRKADNEKNQDGIKIEGLKKTVGKLEEKQKESKMSMEKIYEENICKTERIKDL